MLTDNWQALYSSALKITVLYKQSSTGLLQAIIYRLCFYCMWNSLSLLPSPSLRLSLSLFVFLSVCHIGVKSKTTRLHGRWSEIGFLKRFLISPTK